MPLPGINIDTSKLGINANFSQNLDLGSKLGLGGLKDVVSGGISKISGAAQGLFAGKIPSFNLPTSFPKPDFKASGVSGIPAPAAAAAAAQHRASERAYRASPEANKYTGPAGALVYPANQKYYALFTFNQYERIVANKAPKEKTSISIVLPMPADLKEGFSVSYETPALGAVVGSVTDSVLKGIRSAQGAETTQGSAAEKKLGESVVAALGAGAIKGLGKIGKGGEAAAIAQMASGLAPNPYLAVLFKNVELRTHDFQYRFAPRSLDELKIIKKIISELKRRMLPGMTKGSDMLFTFPDTCDITFGPNKEVPYKIKKCVMTSLAVNYSPNGPAFFKTGDPVIVDIQMSFKEMSPFTRLDLGDAAEDVKLPEVDPPSPPSPADTIGANNPSTPG